MLCPKCKRHIHVTLPCNHDCEIEELCDLLDLKDERIVDLIQQVDNADDHIKKLEAIVVAVKDNLYEPIKGAGQCVLCLGTGLKGEVKHSANCPGPAIDRVAREVEGVK